MRSKGQSVRPFAHRTRSLKRTLTRGAFLLIVLSLAGACGTSPTSSPTESFGGSPPATASSRDDDAIWSSSASTSMINDRVGDAHPETSPFMDTVAYGVDWVRTDAPNGGTFLFRFAVAEPIPDSFDVPIGYDAAQYSFCLDTDPSTSPGGYPFANDDPVWCEFILTAVSDGGAWIGTLIDRRPLLTGGEAETPAVTFLTKDTNCLLYTSDAADEL